MPSDQTVDLKIIGGRVVTPAGIQEGVEIAVKDGRIVAMGSGPHLPAARETINVKGKYVLPGLVDSEAHPGCYVPFDKDIKSETWEAAAVGVTTWGIHAPSTRLGAEPFQEYVQPEHVLPFSQVLDGAIDIINQHSAVDVFLTFMIETDAQAAEIPLYAEKWGVTSHKLYLQSMKPELDKYWAGRRAGLGHGFDDGTVYQVMEQTAKIGRPGIVAIHPENWQIGRVFEKRLIEAGRTDFGAWTDRSPDFCEAHHVHSYSFLAKVTRCPLYIQHATTPLTYETILKARGEGIEIYAQTGPAWLYLTPENGWRINVPLRRREQIEKIWEALAGGVIDAVGSDHVISWDPPVREEMYNENIWKLRTGFTSRVGMLTPVMLSEGVNKGRISLERMVEVCCENPAKIFGLYPKKGALQVGADADLVVVDLDKEVTVDKRHIFTRSGWSIVEGHTFTGWPVMTILRGQVVAEWPDDAEGPRLVGQPSGVYLPRVLGHQLYPLAAE
ncbi:MAG TPA: amidohydrolase family protein [Anaerolineae bacterium]|nr:amidohydrolase family protein [Anaerolineae bacterium]